MKIVIAAVLIGLLIPMLTACNTVAGIGEDMKRECLDYR